MKWLTKARVPNLSYLPIEFCLFKHISGMWSGSPRLENPICPTYLLVSAFPKGSSVKWMQAVSTKIWIWLTNPFSEKKFWEGHNFEIKTMSWIPWDSPFHWQGRIAAWAAASLPHNFAPDYTRILSQIHDIARLTNTIDSISSMKFPGHKSYLVMLISFPSNIRLIVQDYMVGIAKRGY